MKRFFYLCAALLCLSLAFHFGYTTAKAQAPGNPVVAAGGISLGAWVVTANGDIYQGTGAGSAETWTHFSNVFSGGPTPALHESWGQLKSRYAPKGGTVSKGADTR
jgi:hypothetical protein